MIQSAVRQLINTVFIILSSNNKYSRCLSPTTVSRATSENLYEIKG